MARTCVSAAGVTLQPSFVLIVGGLEFGPYSQEAKIVICQHLDADGEVLREMALPDVLQDVADDYLFVWGFKDRSYKIQRPLKNFKPKTDVVSNRQPLILRNSEETGIVAFLRATWPDASAEDLQALLDGKLPWVPKNASARKWIASEIPSEPVFVREGSKCLAIRASGAPVSCRVLSKP